MNIPGMIDIDTNKPERGTQQMRPWQAKFDQREVEVNMSEQANYGFQPTGLYPFGNEGLAQKNKRPVWVVIDRASRVAFPLAFIIFNCSYWPYLLIGSSKQ